MFRHWRSLCTLERGRWSKSRLGRSWRATGRTCARCWVYFLTRGCSRVRAVSSYSPSCATRYVSVRTGIWHWRRKPEDLSDINVAGFGSLYGVSKGEVEKSNEAGRENLARLVSVALADIGLSLYYALLQCILLSLVLCTTCTWDLCLRSTTVLCSQCWTAYSIAAAAEDPVYTVAPKICKR